MEEMHKKINWHNEVHTYWCQFWCHIWWSLKTLKMSIESIFGQFCWPSYLMSKLTSISVNLIMSIYYFFVWTSSIVCMFDFLGGLSLHLNHLIAERVSAPYRQFGTLPIGIFLSNLDSGQLETSLMTSYCHFWNLSTFGDSRAIWVFWPKLGVFRKSKFSRWRSDGASMQLGGVLGSQITRLCDGTIFRGVWHT